MQANRILISDPGLVVTVREVLEPSELLELGAFRLKVYEAQEVVIPSGELDSNGGWTDEIDSDPSAIHIIVRYTGKIVAAGRVSLHTNLLSMPDSFTFGDEVAGYNGPYASFNRLVVDPNYRGMGLAATIVKFRTELAKGLGANTFISCAIGKNRRDYFASLGWTTLEAMTDPTWDLGDVLVYKVIKRVDESSQGEVR